MLEEAPVIATPSIPNAILNNASTASSMASNPGNIEMSQSSQSDHLSSDSESQDTDTTTIILQCEAIDFNKLSAIKVTRALRDQSIGTFRALPTRDGDLRITVQRSKVGEVKLWQQFMGHNVNGVIDTVPSSSGPRTYI